MAAMAELPPDIEEQVARALAEDVGSGDVTARLVPQGARALATLVTREDMILCGSAWLRETFRQLDTGIAIDWRAQEGDAVAANAVICEIRGPARALLTGERCALNFLQTLSGTATATRRHVNAVAGTQCRILDTRKTIPGLRLAQKYAVRCGGGHNHRLGLHDMVLVKENHIIAAGSIARALHDARTLAPGIPVEVEVEDLVELRAALAARPDTVMLDEFGLEDMRTAVRLRNELAPDVRIEASGGVDLERLREIAATGVDCISVGALTKHVRAIDLSLRFTISQP
jgi:nicotinate-nucleotide pyrophosphorylase (carboxylating)